MRLLLLAIVLVLAGCATTCPPPKNKDNVGAIFNQYPHWYQACKKTEKKWGVPANVQMAIIYYESSFKGDARPPHKRFLGIPLWKRESTAYGYAQALDGTWEEYLASAGGWRLFTKRNKFESATDFIGWYSDRVRRRLGIPADDPYNLYLAYHEGMGGFQRQSYLKKPWLMNYAKKVASKAQAYQNQLAYYEHPYESPPPYLPSTPIQAVLPPVEEPAEA